MIQHVIKIMKCAIDWTETDTGAGVKDNETHSFWDAVLMRCRWYFELIDIMKDRAGMYPKVTTDMMMVGMPQTTQRLRLWMTQRHEYKNTEESRE